MNSLGGLSNQEMAKVFFRYKPLAALEEFPLVVGSHLSLGMWNPGDGCPLSRWNSHNECWSSDAPVLLPTDVETEYKYAYRRGGQLIWETLPCNRLVRPASDSLIVEDEEESLISRIYIVEPRRYDSKSPACQTPLLSSFPASSYCEADRVLIVSLLSPLVFHWSQTPEGQWTYTKTTEPTPWIEGLYRTAVSEKVNFQWIAVGEGVSEMVEKISEKHHITLVPIPSEILSKHNAFCTGVLEPLLNGLIDINPDDAPQYPTELWDAYRAVNSMLADAIMNETKEDDLIWLHDFHLLMAPSFLARRSLDPPLNLGLSLHTPFPPCDIFRILPNREALLNSLLSCDLVSFQCFEFVRHFLSACKRVLGSNHSFKANGLVAVEYFGREIAVKTSYCGISEARIRRTEEKGKWKPLAEKLREEFGGKKVILAVERIQKSSWLLTKLLAFREYIQSVPTSRLVLVHICVFSYLPVSQSLLKLYQRITELVREINESVGRTVVVVKEMRREEMRLPVRIGYYKAADVYWDCSTRGYSPTVLEFAMVHNPSWRPIVLSPFSILSSTLKSTYKVNPFNFQEILDAFHYAERMQPDNRNYDSHELEALSSHEPTLWGQDFLADLKQSKKNSREFDFRQLGFGDKLKQVALRKNFDSLIHSPKLSGDYRRARNRLILLGNEGTLIPIAQDCTPRHQGNVVSALEELCRDERNSVYVLSDLEKAVLEEIYGGVKSLGLVAEQGGLIKDRYTGFNWQKLAREVKRWKVLAEDVIDLYTTKIEGARKEVRETMVVFIYNDADPDYGSLLARELLSHLELVLQPFSEDCGIISGLGFILVKPIDCDKGAILQKVTHMISQKKGPIDFVLCIGDSVSDEEMFKVIHDDSLSTALDARKISCTVGMKPSLASYYLHNISEVARLINIIKDFSVRVRSIQTKSSYSYNDCSEIFQGREIGDREKPILAVSISCVQVTVKHKGDLFSRDDYI